MNLQYFIMFVSTVHGAQLQWMVVFHNAIKTSPTALSTEVCVAIQRYANDVSFVKIPRMGPDRVDAIPMSCRSRENGLT